ncbi:acetyl-CoA carboxylase biotin carboxylase subunit family protein [Legionella sp. km772]|uniref:ATP-grasp domain-containing protein n=1 Tax=Legionella sp. km772 TaxID=2498111 RepID=UPI0018F73965|nr:ATP-grasp domain-containing protein [Legionella sp. km772]
MKNLFILGGSQLQMDLILEAKKLFFYTFVLDKNPECMGAKWCDEFLAIDIADKELVLKLAKKYNIAAIVTSATELGNITACYVGEKLGLYTNSYQTALNTTNKLKMKRIVNSINVKTAQYSLLDKDNKALNWSSFPAVVKPTDSSGGRGLTYVTSETELDLAINKARAYATNEQILIEEYIDANQYSIETISCNGKHQILAVTHEHIRKPPDILEKAHMIPAHLDSAAKSTLEKLIPHILDAFQIKYGACHIELKHLDNNELYLIEIASRTGGMRSEMINLAYGISYSQLLLLAALNIESALDIKPIREVWCKFIINYSMYEEYLADSKNPDLILLQPQLIKVSSKNFQANNLHESAGYYYTIKKDESS